MLTHRLEAHAAQMRERYRRVSPGRNRLLRSQIREMKREVAALVRIVAGIKRRLPC
jgi:hypothetical protein